MRVYFDLEVLNAHINRVGRQIETRRPKIFVYALRGICYKHTVDVQDGLVGHAIKVAGIDHVSIGSDRDHRVIEMSDEYIAELKREEGNNFDASHRPLFMDDFHYFRNHISCSLDQNRITDSCILPVYFILVVKCCI